MQKNKDENLNMHDRAFNAADPFGLSLKSMTQSAYNQSQSEISNGLMGSSQDSSSLRVAILEDNLLECHAITNLLEENNCTVLVENSGAHFLDLLKKSTQPRIVNVSSSQGSLTLHSDPNFIHYKHKGVVYQSSKAALNMFTLVLAYELRELPFKVNAVSPGSTKTDFNRQLGQGSVEDAAKRIIKYATIDQDGPTGKFFAEDMNPEIGEIPW